MHEIGQGSVPTSEPDVETFASLRLAEPSERVNITLDERMLSIQGKRQATIDVRINAIHTMKHHSSNLTPAWLMILGLALIWTGYRVMVPPLYRLGFMGLGGAIFVMRFLTKQPTLTMQTTSGDTHVVYGNERVLNRLSFMFHHLGNGKSLDQVRSMLHAIESELNPDWEGALVAPAPELPVIIQTPQPLDRFLASTGAEIDVTELDLEDILPEWTPTQDPEPVAATHYTSHVPVYFAAQAAASADRYPSDHRPAPVDHPVLLPVSAPPMHQGTNMEPGQPVFLPSFMGPAGAHVPHLNPQPEPEDEAEPLLEAEQVEDAVLEAELIEPAPTPPTRQDRETLLRPKAPRSLDDTVFTPRRTRSLRPNPPSRGRALRNTLRSRTQQISQRFSQPSTPRPYGTTETSAALREQAEASRAQQSSEVMASLSEENGGVLDAESAARLQARTSSILAAAENIQQQQQSADLDTLSFGELQPSKTEEDTVDVPRLDED